MLLLSEAAADFVANRWLAVMQISGNPMTHLSTFSTCRCRERGYQLAKWG
jgi:hypothetical protein